MQAFFRIAFAAMALLVAAAPLRAEMTPEQRKEFEQVIREYLLANPELLEEAITVLRERREKEAALAQTKTIEESGELIFNSQNQMVLGNPAGAVTLVEFFDYNCGYCKRAVSDMTALIDANADLRVVMKEFPILSEGSMQAARISVAVKDIAPERYLQFHAELFSRPGQADATKALEVARDLGLDAEALKKASEASAVSANIEEVRGLATSLGISGTPSYVIGKEIVPGAIGFDGLQEKVAAMRNCGATLC
ncbi:MAG: DsbA family protein [Propylenella sp.]